MQRRNSDRVGNSQLATLSPTCAQRAFVVLHAAESLSQFDSALDFKITADDEQWRSDEWS